MIRTSTLLLLALAMTSGCAAGSTTYGAGATAGTPPPLPEGAVAPRWDHYCAGFKGGIGGERAFTALLDQASSAGWEMVTMSLPGSTIFICFKRPHFAAAEAPAAPPA